MRHIWLYMYGASAEFESRGGGLAWVDAYLALQDECIKERDKAYDKFFSQNAAMQLMIKTKKINDQMPC